MKEAVRGAAIFSAILIAGGVGGCIAGSATGDTVPIVLGVIAAVCGLVLAVLTFKAGRKNSS
ncbi:hypothetical protein HFV08_05925 [Streptomyces sp. LD120]|uniref:Lipoprotein n=1 Tax=Streptomyces physcomitrii TaxID=2724184 RepID=A0ABX1GXF9_9ACTN|nr:hypothetical protein [Streptomyces physcomitrii]